VGEQARAAAAWRKQADRRGVKKASRPRTNRTASQRATLRLRHRANPMRTGAATMPVKYRAENAW
jgi:hypothetical protein